MSLVSALGLLGIFARLRAMAFPADEMFRSFPTEDGYLMLTVARNLALGHGMSTAAGTLPTNGVQPLATTLQALGFAVVGGDREAGLRLLLGVYALVAIASALLIVRLGKCLIGESEEAHRAAWLGAAIWLASPVTLFHTMNMLETGLYAATVVAVALFFARGHAAEDPVWPSLRCVAQGALLGLAFWARNDAVFLMGAVGVAHLATAGRGVSLWRRLAETALMALVVILVAFPWLAHNLWLFGSLIPISGHAYLGAGSVEAGLKAAAVALFEYLTLVFSWKYSPLQFWAPFVAACTTALGALALRKIVIFFRKTVIAPTRSPAIVMAVAFAVLLVAFYVFFFEAPHFVRRYLFPVSPFLALLWGWTMVRLQRKLVGLRIGLLTVPLGLILVMLFYQQSGMTVTGPWRQDLFRGVEWIERELSEEVWVGALQSGTIGFFHDRTINLDGKVNPAALAAVKASRHQQYVLESNVEYLVDWVSLLEPWAMKSPKLLEEFEWVLLDREVNLAILRRRPGDRQGVE
jgi:hypothetical protein